MLRIPYNREEEVRGEFVCGLFLLHNMIRFTMGNGIVILEAILDRPG